MQLLFNRTKIFQSHTPEGGELRYVGNIGTDGRAPAWVVHTNTFKLGIKDGSIIDLRQKAADEEADERKANGEPVGVEGAQDDAELVVDDHKVKDADDVKEPKPPAGLQDSHGTKKKK